MAFEPMESDENFPTKEQEAAEAERKEWFEDCAQFVAVQAVRMFLREAKAENFDADEFYESALEYMQGQDVWDQAVGAEQTTAERHQSYSEAINLMLGVK